MKEIGVRLLKPQLSKSDESCIRSWRLETSNRTTSDFEFDFPMQDSSDFANSGFE
jgi:hypothetical protein